jgi:hypothetical protein
VITFSIGSTLGPIVGGYLSKPAEKFSSMDTPFWHDHPFLLPCIVSASWGLFGAILGAFLLPESEVWQRTRAMKLFAQMSSSSTATSTASAKSSHPEIPRDAYTRVPNNDNETDHGNGRTHHGAIAVRDARSDAKAYSKLNDKDNDEGNNGNNNGGGSSKDGVHEVGYLGFSSIRQEIPIYTTTPAAVVSTPSTPSNRHDNNDDNDATPSYSTFSSPPADRSKHIEDINFDKGTGGTYSSSKSSDISPSSVVVSMPTAESLAHERAERDEILAARDAGSCRCGCQCCSRACDRVVLGCLFRLLPPDAKQRYGLA